MAEMSYIMRFLWNWGINGGVIIFLENRANLITTCGKGAAEFEQDESQREDVDGGSVTPAP